MLGKNSVLPNPIPATPTLSAAAAPSSQLVAGNWLRHQ